MSGPGRIEKAIAAAMLWAVGLAVPVFLCVSIWEFAHGRWEGGLAGLLGIPFLFVAGGVIASYTFMKWEKRAL